MKKIHLNAGKLQLMKEKIISLSTGQLKNIQGGSAQSGDPHTPTCHYPPTYFCQPAQTLSNCPPTDASACVSLCGVSCTDC
ncbi:hypothetical protein EDB95_1558 [Dinghuibacter silviterrae]|uniref:Uncharacterized protein n=1 Tax=Dinghuibacter silviterrae TaxID=1539049 RepID=A0A4V3GLR3_9BACT|nr:hypothetical protein EDB95_1558 [Dinghuibacter silviterrae]